VRTPSSLRSDAGHQVAADQWREVDPRQAALLSAVGDGASLEQLTLVLGRPAPELAAQLLELELAGRLRPEPGLCWRPS
jgi:predicted Rossmann fold nucleotide-binding protein DprA/Smf involved in DNA uptake